jgi:ferric-dicitrate binding protein FerR (iron transport regulator)
MQKQLQAMKNEPLDPWYKESFESLSETPPADVWDAISGNIQADGASVPGEAEVIPLRKKSSTGMWLKIAAIGAFLAGGTYATSTYVGSNNATPFQYLSYTDLLQEHTSGFSEHHNLELIDIFYLPDSTLVYLNKNSRLSYPDEFAGTERVVVLEGEAFFDVSKDKAHPFIIYSGNTCTEIAGTSFNLRAYEAQQEFELTVVTGTVNFSLVGTPTVSEVTLTANERGTFSKSDLNLTEVSTEDDTFNDWLEDQAALAGTSLYQLESSAAATYAEVESAWEQNANNETVIGGAVRNSSVLLTLEKITFKATYRNAAGEKVASKFFEIEERVAPGTSIDYEHVMLDWIENTNNIDITIESIELMQ